MTAAADVVTAGAAPNDAPAPAQPVVVAQDVESAPAPEVPEQPPEQSPAQEFLTKAGLFEKLGPLRLLNDEMRQPHPHLEDLFPLIEASPDLLKRFLKFANGGWFNTRVQVDSPYMAYTRFGTAGFYKITLASTLSEAIGELTTRFRIWPHLESVARTGEMMAQQLAPQFSDDLFAIGLVHDAAVPPMQRELEDYLYFLECALGTDPLVTGLENRCHAFDHAEAAGALAKALAFEDHIVHAVAAHHQESMSSVPVGDSRVVLGLLLSAKRTLRMKRTDKKHPFETATEKALLTDIAAALGVSTGRVLHAIGESVEILKVQDV